MRFPHLINSYGVAFWIFLFLNNLRTVVNIIPTTCTGKITTVELGIYSFGEVPDGSSDSAAQRIRELLAEIELADQVGLDVFGVGEHHQCAPLR